MGKIFGDCENKMYIFYEMLILLMVEKKSSAWVTKFGLKKYKTV